MIAFALMQVIERTYHRLLQTLTPSHNLNLLINSSVPHYSF